MTSLELFAFVVLPIGLACSAWAFVLVAERRGAAKASACKRGGVSTKQP